RQYRRHEPPFGALNLGRAARLNSACDPPNVGFRGQSRSLVLSLRVSGFDPGCVKTSPAHRHGEWFFINREIKSATMNLPSYNSHSTEVHSMHHSRHHVFTQPRTKAAVSGVEILQRSKP